MLIQKSFRHPLHMVNYFRAFVKSALRAYRIPAVQKPTIPQLDRDLDYYFIFESAPKEAENALIYGITCFDSDGVVMFSHLGQYPVSLWRFRRQGIARSMEMMEGLVKMAFKRKNIPLHGDTPFRPFADGVYLCNIAWTTYNSLLKL